MRSFRALDKKRFAAHPAKGSHWRVDAAGDESASFGKGGFGAGADGHGRNLPMNGTGRKSKTGLHIAFDFRG
jgi:hypothetical protein